MYFGNMIEMQQKLFAFFLLVKVNIIVNMIEMQQKQIIYVDQRSNIRR